jgi:surfeit locus 1 family protein
MPRWKVVIALVAAALGIAATIGLGNWQTRRAEEKSARQAAWDAAVAGTPLVIDSVESARHVAQRLPRRVRLQGSFVADATVLVGNRMLDGRAGNYVITPLALAGDAPAILVNRGWSPYEPRNTPLNARVPAGTVTIEGIAVERVPRVLELGTFEARLGTVWPNLDYELYEKVAARRVARFVVEQTNDTDDGLARKWVRPDAGVERHRGYAFQWYALAAVLALLTVVVVWRGARQL